MTLVIGVQCNLDEPVHQHNLANVNIVHTQMRTLAIMQTRHLAITDICVYAIASSLKVVLFIYVGLFQLKTVLSTLFSLQFLGIHVNVSAVVLNFQR